MLGNWAVSAKNQVGWSTGFWLGDFSDDLDGGDIHNALKLLEYGEEDDDDRKNDHERKGVGSEGGINTLNTVYQQESSW